MLYFAYGSNMASDVMLVRCPGATAQGSARLDNHRLAFRLPSQRWGGHAADIADEAGSFTWGVLWAITPEHLTTLDQHEARYDRRWVQPHNERGVEAVTYRVKPDSIGPDGSPHPTYLDHLIQGAIEHGLPKSYVAELRSYLAKG